MLIAQALITISANGGFSVKSIYKKLEVLMLESTISVEQRRVFTHIWKSSALSKLVTFSWKLLHDRIPTKVNLWHKQVLPPESSVNCVLREGILESADHLFIHCVFATEVWKGW